MERLFRDLRLASRSLLRSPGFTAVAVLTLALGIGANTAIFSVVNGVLLKPLAYGDPDRLVAIFAAEGTELRNPTSPADFLDWREQSTSVEHMTAARPWTPTLTGADEPEQLSGLMATPGLFTLLGEKAALGSTFPPETADADGRVVVLGHSLWQRRFGGDPRALGQTMTLDGEPYTVVGVMPPGFQFPPFWVTDAELWVPLVFDPRTAAQRNARFLRVFGRLAPGATMEQARAEMDAIAARLRQAYPASHADVAVTIEELREPVVSGIRPALLVLLGVVGFVLLIASVNVANLLLGRATSRARESAIRSALGASRGRLVRQWMAESALLALLGGGAGLLLAVLGVGLLVVFSPVEVIPRLTEVRPDGRVLGFTLGVSLLTVAVFGIGPALRASRVAPGAVLRTRGGGSTTNRRVRNALAGSQIALALVLLIAAGLMLKSFVRLQRLDPGFATENRLAVALSLAASDHAQPSRQTAFFAELVRRTEGMPGVRSAAVINHLPIAGDLWRGDFTVDGRPGPDPDELPTASQRVASDGYFRTMSIPLLHGRAFDARDAPDAVPTVMVNQTLARRIWGEEIPLGQRIRFGDDADDPWLTIVGVVGDTKQQDLTEPIIPEVYFPYSQNPVSWFTGATLVVHHSAGAAGIAEGVKRQVWSIDRGVPVAGAVSIEQLLSEHLTRQRLITLLLAAFAVTAVALAMIGLYGVISFLAGQRTHEFGVRLALGAAGRDVAGLILRESLALTGAAVAVGSAVTLAVSRFLQTLLFGVSATDPGVFAAGVVFVLAVALLASYLPARSATRADPMAALRAD